MKELQAFLTEKNILTIFFPGLVATYPLWIICLQQMRLHTAEIEKLEKVITPLSVVLYILLFIIVYGIGYFLKRIAIRVLERRFDEYIENEIAREENVTPKKDPSTFEKTWYAYLKSKAEDHPPLMAAFYHTFIYNYHFELTCMVAIALQLLLIWLLCFAGCGLFPCFTMRVITILSVLLLVYLYWQSKASANEMHRLRVRLCESCADKADEQKAPVNIVTPLSNIAENLKSLNDMLTKTSNDQKPPDANGDGTGV